MREFGSLQQHPEASKQDPEDRLGARISRFFSKKREQNPIPKITKETPQADSELEDLKKLEEIGRQLDALGVNEQSIASSVDRKISLSTSSEFVFEYVKLYLKIIKKVPVAEISIGKNFTHSQVLSQLDKVVQALPGESPEESALIHFYNRVQGGNVALAISVGADVDAVNKQMNDFANVTRSYQQHDRGFVVVYAKDHGVFDKGDLTEMVINTRSINEREK